MKTFLINGQVSALPNSEYSKTYSEAKFECRVVADSAGQAEQIATDHLKHRGWSDPIFSRKEAISADSTVGQDLRFFKIVQSIGISCTIAPISKEKKAG